MLVVLCAILFIAPIVTGLLLANDSTFIAGITAAIEIVSFALVVSLIAQKYYKQGQIDAMTGKAMYELKVMPDSTKIWVEKGEKEWSTEN